MQSRSGKYRVGVLGATGLVGQLFVEYLLDHPWFELTTVTGSDRTVGQRYDESMDWLGEVDLPDSVKALKVTPSVPSGDLDLVVSALHKDVAVTIEPLYADAGVAVVSNASAFRMAKGVPLIIPEVNASHIASVRLTHSGGFILASPNCSTIGLASALAPLRQDFGLSHVHVTTLQAVSGAGIPGVPSMHALANVIPYIGGEEEKLETEPLKILGSVRNGEITAEDFKISAQCNRVPVVDGHVCSVSVKLKRIATLEDVRRSMVSFEGEISEYRLPTKPERLIRLYDAPSHPQPRLHANRDAGMTVAVGRLRPCPINDVRFTVLVHNTKRGAAGNAILIAELAAAKGLLGVETQQSTEASV